MINSLPSAGVSRIQEVLKLASIAQNQGTDVPEPDLMFLSLIKDFFNAQGIEALFVDLDNPNQMQKKACGLDGTWSEKIDPDVNRGGLFDAYKSTQILIVEPDSSAELESHDLIQGIEAKRVIFCPISSHSICFGAIGLINPSSNQFTEQDISLLMLLVSKLAGHLFYHKVMKESRITHDELKVSKLQLLQSRNTLRTLFDGIPEAFYIVDKDYRILAINRSRASVIGAAPKDLVGRICFNALFRASAPCQGCLVQKSLSTSNPTRRFDNRRGRDNEPLEFEVSTYPILESNGHAYQVIVLEQDVTEKRRMEAELLQGEKASVVGQLAAGIVHEINNPLTTVLANAQMLLQDLSPDQTDMIQSVKLIEMSTQRANQVVQNILSLVRSDSYEPDTINVNESIQNALILLSHDFLARKISVMFDRADPMPLLIGSSSHLQSVWTNLLMNAIEAIQTDKGEIKITTIYENGNYYIEFRDNGKGISEDNLDKIFIPFFSTKVSEQATGLGLPLVKKIVQAHGGRVQVESSPETGSKFMVILPEHHEMAQKSDPSKFSGLF